MTDTSRKDLKAQILTGLARCYYGLLKYEKALNAVEEGLKDLAILHPSDAGYLLSMKGHVLKKMERFEGAIEAFTRAFELFYNHYGYVNKAVASIGIGHWYCQLKVNPSTKFYYFMGDFSWESRLMSTHKSLMHNFDQSENKVYLEKLHQKVQNPKFTREMVKCKQNEIFLFQNSAYITNFLRNAAF